MVAVVVATGRNRAARGAQTVDENTGEAKEVEAITVMNVIDYPTPMHPHTHFTEEEKAYILEYGIFTETPEEIFNQLNPQVATVEFLDELWVETTSMVVVADGSSPEGVLQAMLRLVMRPPHRPGATTCRVSAMLVV